MKIKVFATFREICGLKDWEIPHRANLTVRDVLQQIIDQYPPMKEELFAEDGQLLPFVHVFVNGKNIIHGNGLDTILDEKDQLALFPPVGGGGQ